MYIETPMMSELVINNAYDPLSSKAFSKVVFVLCAEGSCMEFYSLCPQCAPNFLPSCKIESLSG